MAEAEQIEDSVHRNELRCQTCHGGFSNYELTAEAWRRTRSAGEPTANAAFDHGKLFRGKPPREEIPAACGTCHADVERVNPYGLRTDQLSAYWTSGHGKTLIRSGDTRVAVCVDCHGAHDILPPDHPQSRTYSSNIPDTCARCHADGDLMGAYGLSAAVVDQYRGSVHGKLLLEHGDAAAPHCATCHGSHAATPPGFASVGHVCGQCHQQIEEYFLSGMHGRLPSFPRCIGCHAGSGDLRNHQIDEASLPPDAIVQLYTRLVDQRDGMDPRAGRASDGPRASSRARFDELMDDSAGSLRLEKTCLYCHAPGRAGAHAEYFEDNDRLARERGRDLAQQLREVQFQYARTAERVARIGCGVVLVRNEALQAEEARTSLQALYAYLHTLDPAAIRERAARTLEACAEINRELDAKERGLALRRATLLSVWGIGLAGAVLLYRKYRLLKRDYVAQAGMHAHSADARALPTRRRMLDAALGMFGAVSGAALVWPYIDRGPVRDPRRRPWAVAMGGAAIVLALFFGTLGYLSERTIHIGDLVMEIDIYGVPHRIEP